ncbi:cytochrome c biogenesis heme-transporting ATPase CcmA [Pseudomonas sp. KNUC1026]|uniref:cytochrome c biogenesis heme-transporting ATPase CcmA n=1 Tax=Pseudomonas sp. KNUC1026 TaxID=2893890 RepID=UPI001F157A82|nr:cytochrome c biogenesis heme-transporting ATPase CcmA [Pseudomonas sp. KNUC1026]UFH51572.1 cytochrome c biogenesis heme-transporting ATPase CcmA [Pseudomonas sp. KNUC1026]
MTLYLQARDLACERDGRLPFDALNLALAPGAMLRVCGPNGSGKSTLLRVLAGLMAPAQGEVERSAPWLWLGHAAGINEHLSAEENLAWLSALPGNAPSRAALWQALAAVGLAGYEDVPCHTLSAGQKRRVALARLHLPSAPLWLLDEPFTALDAQAVGALEAHLVAHCEGGGAVVLTTHHALALRPARYSELELAA